MARSIVVVRKEKGDLVGLTGADLDCIAKARAFAKSMHREVYRCLDMLCQLDESCDLFSQDFSDNIKEYRENWARWHVTDLTSEKAKVALSI